MKKILFVSYQMSNGGSERAISVLSNEMIKLGYVVGLILYVRKPKEYPINDEVEIFVINDGRQLSCNPFLRKYNRIKKIKRVLEKFQPDCCIPFLKDMVIETYLASKNRWPVIATVRNKPIENNVFAVWVRNFFYGKCEAIFMQNESQKKYFNKKIIKKTFIVPNAVGEDLYKYGKKRAYNKTIKKIITCGRLDKQKNQLMLIKAMLIVHRENPDVCLYIYGNGSLYQELQEKIKQYDASEYIKLCGWCQNINMVYNSSDLFVFSSNYEGMPNALMEAMASGLPCISTKCPTGPSELLGLNERGILIPINDSQAMANAIIYMIDNPKKAAKWGRMAHKYIEENFSSEIITKRLLDNCRRVVKNER